MKEKKKKRENSFLYHHTLFDFKIKYNDTLPFFVCKYKLIPFFLCLRSHQVAKLI